MNLDAFSGPAHPNDKAKEIPTADVEKTKKMARQGVSNNNGGNGGKVSGKVRFVMLEAEVTDGNFGDIMQAIATAVVRPQPIIQQIMPALQSGSPGADGVDGITSAQASPRNSNGQESLVFTDDMSQSVQVSTPPVKPKQQRDSDAPPRVYPQPEALDGINWDGNGISIKQMAEAKKAAGHVNRFLVVAAWFRLHGGLATITLKHVFTAYQMIRLPEWKWETDKDMSQMFRDGMRPQKRWYVSDKKGGYRINDVGLNAVKNMGGEAKFDTISNPAKTNTSEAKEEKASSEGEPGE